MKRHKRLEVEDLTKNSYEAVAECRLPILHSFVPKLFKAVVNVEGWV